VKRAARGSLKIQDAKIAKNSQSGHHRTTFSGHIFATKTRIISRKNLFNSNISPTCPCNMVNFGRPLAPEICWRVWGTPTNVNGFRVLSALLHGTPIVGVSQSAKFNRGRHLYSAGRPSRWALAHILVIIWLTFDHSDNFYSHERIRATYYSVSL